MCGFESRRGHYSNFGNTMDYDPEFIHNFAKNNPLMFLEAIKLGLWAAKADELGRELVYMDDELMVFRRKKNDRPTRI